MLANSLQHYRPNATLVLYVVVLSGDPSRQLESEIKIPDENLDIRRHRNWERLGCIYWWGTEIPCPFLQGSKKCITLVRLNKSHLHMSGYCHHLWAVKHYMVWPHLEYGNVIRQPKFRCDRVEIEKIQRRATKLIPELKHLPYNKRLRALRLPSLHLRAKFWINHPRTQPEAAKTHARFGIKQSVFSQSRKWLTHSQLK